MKKNNNSIRYKSSTSQSYLNWLIIILVISLAAHLFIVGSNWKSYAFLKKISQPKPSLLAIVSSIRQIDEALTMSVLMSATTANPLWEKRYIELVPQLDSAIQEAKRISPDFYIGAASNQTEKANTELVKIEKSALELVRQHNLFSAFKKITSKEYLKQKKLYAQGFHQMLLKLNERKNEQQVEEGTKFLLFIMYSIIVHILLVLAGIFIIRKTKKHENKLKQQNKKLLEIAYLQSHMVRRPVASILGLINLIKLDKPDAQINFEVIPKLEIVTKELDSIIFKISQSTNEINSMLKNENECN